MSGRSAMHIDISSSNPSRRPRPPRMPLRQTPLTPSASGFASNSTPTPVMSTPTPANDPPLPVSIEMEQLHIDDEVYVCHNEDLEDKGSIGEGHFGVVSKMYHVKTKQNMAVKKIPLKDLRVSDGNVLELDVIKKGKLCPFIVHSYGCLLREGHVWICMELLDSSMAQVSDIVYKTLNERIPEDILGKMTVAMIKALHFLQKELKIIHRDVKPSNILVSTSGDFKLCDFGISGKLVDSIARTMDVGCRPYMAPERIDPVRASLGYTIQSDVWSYGITLVELAQGSFPYSKWNTIFDQLNAVVSGPPPVLPADTFSEPLQQFTAACLVKDSLKRPNYEQLQEMEFFKHYNSGSSVDVMGWYTHIKRKKGEAQGGAP